MYNNNQVSQNPGYNNNYRGNNALVVRSRGGYNNSQNMSNTSAINQQAYSRNTSTINQQAYSRNTSTINQQVYSRNTSAINQQAYSNNTNARPNTNTNANTSVAKSYKAQSYNGCNTYAGASEVTFGSGVMMFVLLFIPVVNIIYAAVQAIMGDNSTKKNFARAYLFFLLLSLAITLVICVFLSKSIDLEYLSYEIYKIVKYVAKSLL